MFVIKNIKISLKLYEDLHLNSVLERLKSMSNITLKNKHNFLIIYDIYVYIIFKSNSKKFNHINVTKIPNENDIMTAISRVLLLINLPTFKSHTIDNITAIMCLKQNIDLLTLMERLQDKYEIIANKEKFPGIFIHFHNGMVIVFHSGKIISVGCKSINTLNNLYLEINSYLNHGL
jgi:hypothetical protein